MQDLVSGEGRRIRAIGSTRQESALEELARSRRARDVPSECLTVVPSLLPTKPSTPFHYWGVRWGFLHWTWKLSTFPKLAQLPVPTCLTHLPLCICPHADSFPPLFHCTHTSRPHSHLIFSTVPSHILQAGLTLSFLPPHLVLLLGFLTIWDSFV